MGMPFIQTKTAPAPVEQGDRIDPALVSAIQAEVEGALTQASRYAGTNLIPDLLHSLLQGQESLLSLSASFKEGIIPIENFPVDVSVDAGARVCADSKVADQSRFGEDAPHLTPMLPMLRTEGFSALMGLVDVEGLELDEDGKLRVRLKGLPDELLDYLPDGMNPLELTERAIKAIPLPDTLKSKYFPGGRIKPLPVKELLADVFQHIRDNKRADADDGLFDLSKLPFEGLAFKLSMGGAGSVDAKRRLATRADVPLLAGAEVYLDGAALVRAFSTGGFDRLDPSQLLARDSYIDWPDFDLTRLPLPPDFPFKPEGKADLRWEYDFERRAHRLNIDKIRMRVRIPRILGEAESVEVYGGLSAEMKGEGPVIMNFDRLRVVLPVPRAKERVVADLSATVNGTISLGLDSSGQKPDVASAKVQTGFHFKTRDLRLTPFIGGPFPLTADVTGQAGLEYNPENPESALKATWSARGSGHWNGKGVSLQASDLDFRGTQAFDATPNGFAPDFSESEFRLTADLNGKRQDASFAAKQFEIALSPDGKHRWVGLKPGEGLLTVKAGEFKAQGRRFQPEAALAVKSAPNGDLAGRGRAGVRGQNPQMDLGASLGFQTDFKGASWKIGLGDERYGNFFADGRMDIAGKDLSFNVRTPEPYSIRRDGEELIRDFALQTKGRVQGEGIVIRKGSLVDAIVDLPQMVDRLKAAGGARYFQIHAANLKDVRLTADDVKAGPNDFIRREIVASALQPSDPTPDDKTVPDFFKPPSEPALRSELERELHAEIPVAPSPALNTPLAKMTHDWFNRLQGFEMEAAVRVPLTSRDTGQKVTANARLVLKDLGVIEQAGVKLDPGYRYPIRPWDQIPIVSPVLRYGFRILEVRMDPEDRRLETKVSLFCVPIPWPIGIHDMVMGKVPLTEATLKGAGYDLREAVPTTLPQVVELVEKAMQERQASETAGDQANKREKTDESIPQIDLQKVQLAITGDFTNQKLFFGDESLGKLGIQFKKPSNGKHRLEVRGNLFSPTVSIHGVQEVVAQSAKGTAKLTNGREQTPGDLAIQIHINAKDGRFTPDRFTVERFQADNLMIETAAHGGENAQLQLANGFDARKIEFKWDKDAPRISIGRFESKKTIFKGFGAHLETEDAVPAVMTDIQLALEGGKPAFFARASGGMKGQINYFPARERLGNLNFAFIRGSGSVEVRPDPDKGGQMRVTLEGGLETEMQELMLLVRNEKMAGSVRTTVDNAKIRAEGSLTIWPTDSSVELAVKDPAHPATVRGNSGRVEVKQDTFAVPAWREEIGKLFGKLAPYLKTDIDIELASVDPQFESIEFSATRLMMHSYLRPNNGKPSLEITSAKMGDVRIHGNVLGEAYARAGDGLYIRGELGKRTLNPDGRTHIVRMPVTLTLKDLEDNRENGRRVVRFKGIGLEGREAGPTLTPQEAKWCGFEGQMVSGAVDALNFSPDDKEYEAQINRHFEAAVRAGALGCFHVKAVEPDPNSP